MVKAEDFRNEVYSTIYHDCGSHAGVPGAFKLVVGYNGQKE